MHKLVDSMHAIKKGYFFGNDIKKLLNVSDVSVPVTLHRLVHSNQITRVYHNVYTADIANLPWEQLAVDMYMPSYISFEYVLAKYGILSQQPYNITLATLNRSRELETSDKVFTYHHLNEKMFFGFHKVGEYFEALPEKAFLDLLYLSMKGYAHFDLEEMNLELLDMGVMKKLLKQSGNQRLMERVVSMDYFKSNFVRLK